LSYAVGCTLHISAVLHFASDRPWPYGPSLYRFGILQSERKMMIMMMLKMMMMMMRQVNFL
jgi:hypothetical protein